MLGQISSIPSPRQIRCTLKWGKTCCDQYKNTDWTGTNFSMFHHDFDYVIIRCIQINIKADMNLIFTQKKRFSWSNLLFIASRKKFDENLMIFDRFIDVEPQSWRDAVKIRKNSWSLQFWWRNGSSCKLNSQYILIVFSRLFPTPLSFTQLLT